MTEGIEAEYIKRSNQVQYIILNLNAKELRNSCLLDKCQSRIRLNFAPHALLYPNVRFGEEIKVNVLAAIYTSSGQSTINSSFKGIDECTDFGRIMLNPIKFYNKSNF